ncbi:MAG TPA: PH domain-containing protein, partial [Flavobacterium sp.]|nr:PH domain-containing protein [Flavobacterium sp.]
FIPIFPGIINKEWNEERIEIIGFLLFVFAFILYLFFQTQYKIEGSKLKIKCGFFSFKAIEIADITEISKTKSLISSPAPSFDRIEIKYGKFDEIIISPKKKFDFAKHLTTLNPNIKNNLTR